MSETTNHPIKITKRPVQFIDTTPHKRGRPKKSKKKEESPSPKKVSQGGGECVEEEPVQRSVPQLEEWDPRELPNGFFVVLEGKRRTGKSTFSKWLLQCYQVTFSLVWVMSQKAVS